MSTVSYTTIDGATEGRASYFFRNHENAEKCRDDQNARATSLGIAARYKVATTDGDNVNSKDIRD